MVDTRRIRDFVDWTWEEAALPVLTEYTRIPALSPAFDPEWEARGALRDAARLLCEWAANRPIPGLTTRLVEPPGRTPLLVAETAGEGPLVLLYGHLDKQPPLGDWSPGLGPYLPVRREDRLYGRGTADDGYALFAALIALEAAGAERAAERPGTEVATPRCIVVIEASEESGSPDLPAHLEDLDLPAPDLVVCLDSGSLTYDRLWVTTSLRGLVEATLRVDVLRHGVHSGMAGGIVPSSFRLVRQLLSRVEDPETGRVLLAGVAGSEAPDAPPLRWGLPGGLVPEGELPAVPGLRLAGTDVATLVAAQASTAALEVTGADGLPALSEAGNVLRPYTSVKLAMRIPPSADAPTVAEQLRETLTERPPDGAHVRVDLGAAAEGWLAPRLEGTLADAVEEASDAYFGNPPGEYGIGGTIPFLPMLQRRFPAAQFLATGVLGPGSNAHGPDEFLHLPTAKAVTACVAHVLASLR